MEYITIEKLSKEINRSEAVLRRMKGSRIISHSSLKNNSDTYKIQLLSKVNNENNSTYNLDELKIYTAFSLFVKGKPKSYKEDIPFKFSPFIINLLFLLVYYKSRGRSNFLHN